MSKAKDQQPVTVTVRPDGTYYVEKARALGAGTAIVPVYGAGPARKPIAAQITSTLAQFAGIAVAVKAAAPALGPYGAIAALGFGVLRALATPEPPPRITLRRVRKALR